MGLASQSVWETSPRELYYAQLAPCMAIPGLAVLTARERPPARHGPWLLCREGCERHRNRVAPRCTLINLSGCFAGPRVVLPPWLQLAISSPSVFGISLPVSAGPAGMSLLNADVRLSQSTRQVEALPPGEVQAPSFAIYICQARPIAPWIKHTSNEERVSARSKAQEDAGEMDMGSLSDRRSQTVAA
jgi:hypothetical protein